MTIIFFQGFILLKCLMYMFVGVIIGAMYFQFGNDASKTIFNFGYFFVTNIVLLYIPMLPILLSCKYKKNLIK